jgi:hypothetical protein
MIPCASVAEELSEKHSKAGRWGLHVALPWVNNFYVKPDGEKTKHITGFIGSAVGLDYYYLENSFINLGISGVMDFFLPIPVPSDPSPGSFNENVASGHISLSNNHHIGKFTVGYGFAYAGILWNANCFEGETLDETSEKSCEDSHRTGRKSHSALGLIFPVYYRVIKNFGVGIVYRPTFYRRNTSTDKFEYEHLISFEMVFKSIWR